MLLLLFFAFLSGLVTILAPCIWPLLPIVLSAASGGKTHCRPLGVTLGIMVSFAIFTLSISYVVKLFHLDANIVRLLAVFVLIVMGLTMLIPQLSNLMEGLVSRISGRVGMRTTKGDFQGGFLTGLSLGVVWSPCSGPILASIAALAATGQVNLSVILVTLAYVLGVGIPLFIFAYGGQKLLAKTKFLSARTGRIPQVFGVVMLVTALAIFTNYDKFIELKLLSAFPAIGSSLTSFESSATVQNELAKLKNNSAGVSLPIQLKDEVLNTSYPAPEFTGITHWLNTDQPLTLSALKGKVVLVDFWTYTCINCLRTLSHVTHWYETYKDQGFVVVGVHTPEFEFEKNTENVQQSFAHYDITYPVAQDNNYATWNVYNNQYWPAEYLIDVHGQVRRTHFGEGEYDQTEQAIQKLLHEVGKTVKEKSDTMPDETPQDRISPESYLGANRMKYYSPSGNTGTGVKALTLDSLLPLNAFSLGGTWDIQGENAVTQKASVLEYHFSAKNVFLVLHPPMDGKGTMKVFLDGKLLNASRAGSDVKDGVVLIDQSRLYSLVALKKTEEHTLKLEFQEPGIEVFAFTFG